MALAAWDLEPETDERFIKNGNTLLDGLKKFQLPDGGMIHSLDGEEEETNGNNMAGYQALYALEAVCRLREGKCGVFDLSDAPEISKADVEKAGKELPERTEETKKSGEEAQADTQKRTIFMTAGIAGAVVLIVIVFLILIPEGQEKKNCQARRLPAWMTRMMMSGKKLQKVVIGIEKNIIMLGIVLLLVVILATGTKIQSVDEYYLTHMEDISEDAETVTMSIRCDTVLENWDKRTRSCAMKNMCPQTA